MMIRRFGWVWVLWLSVYSVAAGQSATPSIEIFTDAQHAVDTHGHVGARVYPVDAISRFVSRVNSSLLHVHEKGQAEALARAVLGNGKPHADVLAASVDGLRRARRYGVDRVPAMVFDAKAIVYGLTDVVKALEIYRRWRRQAKRP